jgi:hypothetical protein
LPGALNEFERGVEAKLLSVIAAVLGGEGDGESAGLTPSANNGRCRCSGSGGIHSGGDIDSDGDSRGRGTAVEEARRFLLGIAEGRFGRESHIDDDDNDDNDDDDKGREEKAKEDGDDEEEAQRYHKQQQEHEQKDRYRWYADRYRYR